MSKWNSTVCEPWQQSHNHDNRARTLDNKLLNDRVDASSHSVSAVMCLGFVHSVSQKNSFFLSNNVCLSVCLTAPKGHTSGAAGGVKKQKQKKYTNRYILMTPLTCKKRGERVSVNGRSQLKTGTSTWRSNQSHHDDQHDSPETVRDEPIQSRSREPKTCVSVPSRTKSAATVAD